EFGALMARWQDLVGDLLQVRSHLLPAQRDAFFQLVEHPITALGNLYQLYYAVAWNRRLAAANDPRANLFADRAEAAFKRDHEIAAQYHALNGYKWDGMMLQTHIGYTTWQQPDRDLMPEVKRVPASGEPPEVLFAPVADESSPARLVIEATRFARAHAGKGLSWRPIANLGRGLGAVMALPQGRPATSRSDGIYLEYDLTVETPGDVGIALHLLPTLNTGGGVDVRIGVSMDDGPMQTLSMRLTPSPGPPTTQEMRDWSQAVIDNDFALEAKFPGITAGKHVIKVWRVDDNVLLTKMVVGKE
ncbi:MAG TPA: hypothetical protein VFP37_18395, partial [Steroidobacteraceae bacterium]|nr:hypothetical protein [Steroidobacteraceae bacterium]